MQKLVLAMVLLLALCLMAGIALAVPKGKTLSYEGGPMGEVTFSGTVHSEAGLKCNDCHTKIFKMKQGAANITAPHEPGIACGTCHDGENAFAQEANCTRCHKKDSGGY